jgi:hypothetical protein
VVVQWCEGEVSLVVPLGVDTCLGNSRMASSVSNYECGP